MSDSPLTPTEIRVAALRERTPARVLAGRAGSSYRTATQLGLRCDHAFARDAVSADLEPMRDFGQELVERFRLLMVETEARDKVEFLRRPDRGRRLNAQARGIIIREFPREMDLQVVIGDGLSATAVAVQVPQLLPLIARGAADRSWTFGRPFAVRHCRVGVLNDVGELLDPVVVVLLIGERPGLATAESLSAYMAYRPRAGHTDAERNLISNIHARGVSHAEAARRILELAALMREVSASGVNVKERMPVAELPQN